MRVRRGLAEEKQRSEKASHGGKVADIEIGLGVAMPADKTSDKSYFWLPLRLRVAENAPQPVRVNGLRQTGSA